MKRYTLYVDRYEQICAETKGEDGVFAGDDKWCRADEVLALLEKLHRLMWGPHSDAEVASEPLDGSRIRLGGGHP